jgi:Tfp pilus assembly protein PilF
MNHIKYFLFSDLENNDIPVIIKIHLDSIDKSIWPLLLLNKHKFLYYVIGNNYHTDEPISTTKYLVIDNDTSLFYFKLFLMRGNLSLNSYKFLISLDLDIRLNVDFLLEKCLDSDYNSEDILTIVFLLLALNKVVNGINLLSYAKSSLQSFELDKWHKKIIYDYKHNHKLVSELHSDNINFLIKKANELYKEQDFSSSTYYFEKVVNLHQRNDYILKLGLAYRGAYEFDKAISLFNRYIYLHPHDHRGYSLRGLISLNAMRYSEAKAYYEIAINLHPLKKIKVKELTIAFSTQVISSLKNRTPFRFSSFSHYDRFRIKTYIELSNLNMILADIHYSLGEYESAASIYYKIATSIRPDLYTTYEKLNLIDSLLFIKAVNRLDKYINFLEKSLITFSKYPNLNRLRKYIQTLYVTRGRIYILQLDRKSAENSFRSGMKAHTNIKAREWLAYLYLWSQKYEKSLILYKGILEEKPNKVGVIINIIRNYLEQDQPKEASQYIIKYHNLLLKYQNKDKSHLVRRNYYYTVGDIENAWLAFRDRKICDALSKDLNINYTHNIFESRSYNKSVLVLSEWGPGDEIRWASVYPEIKSQVVNLTISCDPRLQSLLQRSFPHIVFVPVYKRIRGPITINNIKKISKVKSSLSTQVFDSSSYCMAQNMDEVTLISDILGEIRKNKPSFIQHSGLLSVDPKHYDEMNEWLDYLPKHKINIGICWKSGLVDVARSVHYSELSLWKRIFELDGINFINLQYSNYESDLDNVKKLWGVDIFTPPIDLRDDFESVAALIKQLDLVISPATAVVELAGMVGAETILFSNSPEIDWRVCDYDKDLWHSSIKHIKAVRNKGYLEAQNSIVNQIYRYLHEKIQT